MKCGSICFHSMLLQPVTAQGKHVRFLNLTQTVLHCMCVVDMWHNRKDWKCQLLCLCYSAMNKTYSHCHFLYHTWALVNVLHASCAATLWWRQQGAEQPDFQCHLETYVCNACFPNGDCCCHVNRNRWRLGSTRVKPVLSTRLCVHVKRVLCSSILCNTAAKTAIHFPSSLIVLF